MALAPVLRELFGLEPDAPNHALYVHPHLPPQWGTASVDHVRVGAEEYAVAYRRVGGQLSVTATSARPATLCLSSRR